MDKALFMREGTLRATFVEIDSSNLGSTGKTFVANVRKRNGHRLNRYISLKNKILELYYQVPDELRRKKIPEFYPEIVRTPKYYFRIKGKSLSLKQKVISSLSRLYYIYRFHMKPCFVSTNHVIRSSSSDGFHRLFHLMNIRGLSTVCHIVYRRLKVLICPNLWTN